MTEGAQDFPTQNMLQHIDCFEPQVLEKSQTWGEAFSELLLLPKDRYSKRNLTVTIPLPKSFNNQGKLTLTAGERDTTLRQTVINHHASHLFF